MTLMKLFYADPGWIGADFRDGVVLMVLVRTEISLAGFLACFGWNPTRHRPGFM